MCCGRRGCTEFCCHANAAIPRRRYASRRRPSGKPNVMIGVAFSVLFAIGAAAAAPSTLPFAQLVDFCGCTTIAEAEAKGEQLGWRRMTAAELEDWRMGFVAYTGGSVEISGWRREDNDGGESLSFWVARGPSRHRVCAYTATNPARLLDDLSEASALQTTSKNTTSEPRLPGNSARRKSRFLGSDRSPFSTWFIPISWRSGAQVFHSPQPEALLPSAGVCDGRQCRHRSALMPDAGARRRRDRAVPPAPAQQAATQPQQVAPPGMTVYRPAPPQPYPAQACGRPLQPNYQAILPAGAAPRPAAALLPRQKGHFRPQPPPQYYGMQPFSRC